MESKPKRKYVRTRPYARLRPFNVPLKTVNKLPALWAEGLSVREIADKLGVSVQSIRRWLRKLKIVPLDGVSED